ncbi:extracellular glycosyl hydrolase family 78 protein [Daldinia childiae]|uniref:extracellular glycosyl hydrolase family 78 protein n=1 Tax=Daldinia childiae TaxID=326645 RepID=UPI001447DCBB|nr:extracellular glycosyl hydrolase family 78 protein [Daldinia childiae]KAF3056224.1 extracellular glycosyl hydrolase family 78 protein [Daldinia childiae]
MAVSISQVSFEHHRVALGIGEASPRISWRFNGLATDWKQGGYSIELSRHKQNQTGLSQTEIFHHNSSDSVLVPWPTVSLASSESATVRVRAYGEGDKPDTPWSEHVNVETGILNQDDWLGAQMISADKETEKDAPHQPLLFRKEFSVNSTGVEKARLYITAYGLYEAQINGKRVGTTVLAPGWQSYKHRLVYDTYDVTALLLAGDNVFGITVGEGWYAGRLGYGSGSRNLWGDTLGAMALLVITSNGKTQSIRTDKSWTASTGPIVTSEIYNGEAYDSRLEQSGWSAPGFIVPDTAEWIAAKELEVPYGILAAPDGPPIQRIEEIKLQEILTSPTGKTIIDFGQNFAGWLRLTVKGKRGDTIKLLHAEVLEGGEVATRPLRNATQTDYLTLSGQLQVWEPSFTYHGFRYVMVDGWPEDDTPLNNDSVRAIVIHSDMEETGYFECEDQLLNKLHKNVRWSMKSNFMSIPTDCPQRDERLGWTGDSLAFAPTANFLYDTSGFWRSWLKDLQSEQVKGVPPLVVPAVPAAGPVTATAVWGDALVANPFNAYHASGDLNALREQYTGAKSWLDDGIPRNEAGLWSRSNFQLGDWLDPKSPPDDPGSATTSSIYVADAYLVYVTGLVAEMASELGLDDDKTRFEKWAKDLKTAFREAWIDSEGIVANETQTGLALPLYFDLFQNESEGKAAASREISPVPDTDPDLALVSPNTDPDSLDLRCGRNASLPFSQVKTATVQAGDVIGFGAGEPMGDTKATMYHPGIGSAWLSKSPIDDLQKYAGDGDWFKILSVTGRTEQSLDYSLPENSRYYDQYKSVWGTFRLDSYNFTIPKTTPPGKYLLRFEHYFPNIIDTQFYVNCAHVEIVNPDTEVGTPGPLVDIPGVYTRGQPDVYFNYFDLQFNISTFTGPEPSVWSG